jgi:hypothetical protein
MELFTQTVKEDSELTAAIKRKEAYRIILVIA